MSDQSATPRTDAFVERRTVIKDNGRTVTADYIVNAAFARQLERELAEARRQSDLMASERGLHMNASFSAELRAEQAVRRAAELEKDARRYRWLRTHFRFANDSVREIWFDPNIDLAGAYGAHEPDELDASIDAAIENEKGDSHE